MILTPPLGPRWFTVATRVKECSLHHPRGWKSFLIKEATYNLARGETRYMIYPNQGHGLLYAPVQTLRSGDRLMGIDRSSLLLLNRNRPFSTGGVHRRDKRDTGWIWRVLDCSGAVTEVLLLEEEWYSVWEYLDLAPGHAPRRGSPPEVITSAARTS